MLFQSLCSNKKAYNSSLSFTSLPDIFFCYIWCSVIVPQLIFLVGTQPGILIWLPQLSSRFFSEWNDGGDNFPCMTQQTDSHLSGFEKWEAKKKKQNKTKQTKKKSSPHSPHFVIFNSHFQFSTFPFYNFPPFPLNFHPLSLLFPCLFFPGRSAEISRSEISGGHSSPCPQPITPVFPCSSHRQVCPFLVDIGVMVLLQSSVFFR